ncbi:hypothetical protein GALMADRAFT_140583 [Galerina marginata CBS 339.88]|uniref:Heterokaryon incompatibility domain-containing protein n=1 Tax=Galerina marginata (strain CBS 339.88) TaxID=685588 RepID=A0A067T7S1_GALM3|nr:hypothetical protein GALMADRAFT_140583 [Galerina marginata CBS 339.88]
MTHPGSYYALSYVWGNPDIKDYTLICNGHGMKITYNLWAALRRIWARWPDRNLWVDAVCINQEDIPERNQQVAMMGQIYGQAECVAIWLGDETSETGAFFETLKLVESGKDLSPANCTWFKDLETGRSFVVDLLNAGDDITRRPWYIRAWTLQEFRLSRAAVVLCGPHMAKFGLVINTISKINEKSSGMDACGARTVSIPIHGPASSFRSLYRLLAFTQDRQATDPRDKIFSLMSLLPRNLYSFMKPDYYMSVEETFTWACRICINIDNEMNCLAGAGLAGREKSNLPSWVVDWRDFNDEVYTWQNLSRSLKDVEANPELCRIRYEKGRMLDRGSTQISIPGLALGVLEVDQTNSVAFLKVFPQCACQTLDSELVQDASSIKLSHSALLKGYKAIRKHDQHQCNCTPDSRCDAYELQDMPEGIETGDWLWTTELGDTGEDLDPEDKASDEADEITHFHYAIRPINRGEDAQFQLVGKTNGLESIAEGTDCDIGELASVGVSWQSTFLFI